METGATAQRATASEEWRRYWYLPIVCGLGYTAPNLFAYGLGPFIEPIQEAFGWTRAQVMVGLMIANMPAIVLLPLMGVFIDRLGPRRIGLIGVCIMPAAFAGLSTATGTPLNWWMLWAFIAIAVPFVQASVWTAPVVSRFVAARGMALAVTLSGSSFASGVMPILGTLMIAEFGWRQGLLAVAGVWFVLMFVPVVFLFRGAQDGNRAAREAHAKSSAGSDALEGLTLPEAVRTFRFYKLLFASFSFAFVIIGVVLHLVPILRGFGAAPMQAAGTAGLVGIFSIIGRLSTGALLDRFASNIVGSISYLLPIPGFLLLILAGDVPINQMVAVALFGLTLGAEVDIITYLITRQFGLKRFASITSVTFATVAVGSALGPLTAGASFDLFGGYSAFMIGAIIMAVLSSLAVLSMARPPYGAAH